MGRSNPDAGPCVFKELCDLGGANAAGELGAVGQAMKVEDYN